MYGGLLMSDGFDAVHRIDVYRCWMKLEKLVDTNTQSHADLF